MNDFWSALDGLGRAFFLLSVFGGVAFVLQAVLQFMASDLDADAAASVPSDAPHASSDIGFKVLSFQGVAAFCLMAGLTGIAAQRAGGFSNEISIVGAAAAGAAAVWIIRSLFVGAKSLQSSGNTDFQSAIGQEGRVYMTIPANGIGKVEVVVGSRLMHLEACQRPGASQSLASDSRVKVVGISNANTLEVEAVSRS